MTANAYTARQVAWGDLIDVERRLGVDAFEQHPQEAIAIVAWRCSGTSVGLDDWLAEVAPSEIGARIKACTEQLEAVESEGDDTDPFLSGSSSGSSPASAASGA